MTTQEVNFEKRGKLEDHIDCPVTGECVCRCPHCHPRKSSTLTLALTFLILLLPTLSWGQSEIHYTIQDLPGIGVRDINSGGDLLTPTAFIPANPKKTLSGLMTCPGAETNSTVFRRLNDRQQIAGECMFGTNRVGFLRQRNGFFNIIDPPAALFLLVTSLSSDGRVCGYYYTDSNNNHSRGFCWKDGQLSEIEYPLADWTTILGVNKHGQAAGTARSLDGLLNVVFIWSNGVFTSLVANGIPLKIFNDGGVLMGRDTDGRRPFGDVYTLIDDDVIFEIALPDLGLPTPIRPGGWPLDFDVVGASEDGVLVGIWDRHGCDTPTGGAPCQLRSFIATPESHGPVTKR